MKHLLNYSSVNNPYNKWGIWALIIVTAMIFSLLTGLIIPFGGFTFFQLALLPAFLVIGLAVWLMPERAYCYEDLLRYMLVLYTISACIWPPYISIIPLPGKIWTPPTRILVFAIAFFALINFSVSKLAKQRLIDLFKTHPFIMKAFTALVILQFCSIPFAISPGESAGAFVKYFINTAVIFLVAITVIRNEKTLQLMIAVSIPILLYYVSLAFFQSSIEANIFGTYFPDWMIGGGESIQTVMRPIYRNGEYRVNGISLTSLEFAELFVYLTPFLLYFVFEHKNWTLKLLALIIIAFAFLGVLKTGSRLGNVGLLFGAMTYIMIWSLRSWLNDGKNLLGPAIVTMYVAGVGAFIFVMTASARIRGTLFGDSTTANSSNARIDQLNDGIPIIFSNPLFGHGIGMGAQKLGYRNLEGVLTIDSYWLSVVIETGITGLICFILLFSGLIWTAARFYIFDKEQHFLSTLGASFASSIACFLLIKLILSQSTNNTLMYIIAAFTIIVSHIIITSKKTAADFVSSS